MNNEENTLNMYNVLASALAAPQGCRAEIYSIVVTQPRCSKPWQLRTVTAVDRTAGTVSSSLSAKASGVPAGDSGSAVGVLPTLRSLHLWQNHYSASPLRLGG